MEYRYEIEIARSPDEVYAYLSDPEHLPEWQAEVTEVRVESPERFVDVRTFLGRRVESTMEVTTAEPGSEYSIRAVSGPVRFSVRHLLEPAGEGRTKVTVLGEAPEGPGGLFKLGGPLLKRAAVRRFHEDFGRLKARLEG